MNSEPNDDLLRILRANAHQTERQERPSAENLAALRAGGAFALRTPTAHGGAGADPVTLARTLAALGRACPSTAWIVGTCATGKTMATGRFDDTALKEYFADPDALGCGSGGPTGRGERGPDGVRVTGRWPNVSGCEDAGWAILGVMVEGAYSWALIPMTELSIDRTWQMAGMRGTGSHTVVAEQVLVPAERVVAAAPPPPAQRLLFAITVLGPMVGAARGALDEITAMFASDRKPYLTAYTRMGESPGARQWLAEATFCLERAERTLMAVAAAAAGPEPTESDAARWSMALADGGRDCRQALERMLDLHGSSGFKTANALQRYWRDVSVGTRHPMLNPYLAVENFGQMLVGAL